nr:hypothetical protein EATA8330_44580 [Enterobacter asburiae]
MLPTILKCCPYCGKLTNPYAGYCYHCHISSPFERGRRRERRRNILWAALVMIFSVIMILNYS